MGCDGGAWFRIRARTRIAFVPQGIGADLIATLEGFSRDDVDAFALRSHQRAAAARAAGRFASSVVPVHDIARPDRCWPRTRRSRRHTDDGGLATLEPAFAALGAMGFDATALRKYPQVERIDHVHHAGNSSGIVDGAALMLVGSKRRRRARTASSRARASAAAAVVGASRRSC